MQIAAWQPGEEGGSAIAALLFGDVDFSGALAVTVYKEAFSKFSRNGAVGLHLERNESACAV